MSAQRPLILIVDDNEDILFHLGIIIEENGYQTQTATSGADALELLSNIKELPDLIISDIMMPEMDGYEFFVEVSSNPLWYRIPFIFLTAKSTPEDIIPWGEHILSATHVIPDDDWFCCTMEVVTNLAAGNGMR